jgi:hypothetical protein
VFKFRDSPSAIFSAPEYMMNLVYVILDKGSITLSRIRQGPDLLVSGRPPVQEKRMLQ